MQIYQLVIHIIHFICFFTSLSIGICEITIISYYDNKNFVLESENQKYDFIYLSSIQFFFKKFE